MVYVKYDYYTNNYFGKLELDKFTKYVNFASRIVDNNINTVLDENKIKELNEHEQDSLKTVVCALIDLIYEKNKSQNISSVSIDGVSKTYKNMNEAEYKNKQKEILEMLPLELTRYI